MNYTASNMNFVSRGDLVRRRAYLRTEVANSMASNAETSAVGASLSFELKFLPVIFLFVAIALQLYVRLEIVNSFYQVNELRNGIAYKQSSLSKLNFALEQAYQPDFIVQNAKNKLGLVSTPPQRIRRLQ